jgi:glycosyltransferase involved in cell wall biosynthesis
MATRGPLQRIALVCLQSFRFVKRRLITRVFIAICTRRSQENDGLFTGIARRLLVAQNVLNWPRFGFGWTDGSPVLTETRIHVLFLIPSLRGGGAERVIVTLLRHMNRSLFRLGLAVVDMREAVYRDDVLEDVEIVDLGSTRVRYALPKIMRLIWRRRPDVVFSTLGHLNLALAMLRPLLPNGVRYIGQEVCVVSEAAYPHPRLWRWAYRRFYRRFDVVVCLSVHMREELISRFGFPPGKAVIIRNPVDIERIRCLAAEVIATDDEPPASHADAVPHLVAAGRLSREKGFDLLIEALAKCDDRGPRLTLLGEGPLRAALEELAQQRGVAHRVRFVGFQKNPYPFFVQADAFVLSSRCEASPMVVLEALACRTSVIAMPCPGGVAEIAELVGGVLLASAVDAEALSVAIKRFFAGETGTRRIALAPFHVDKIVEQYQSLLIGEALRKVALHER